ncbi:ankyrin-2 [Aspergillus niger]|nr:ankyrin-2 [Aspergillus niger]
MNMSELKRELCRLCKRGTKTLFAAVREGHKECVQIILEDPEMFPVFDATKALGYAVRYNQLEIARLMLEAGAYPSPELDGETWDTSPLHHATIKSNLEMVKLLLEFKADVNQSDLDTCMIPLSTATALGHTEIVRCLLESEADINLENRYGEASLHIATRLGHLEITQLLLTQGTDVDKLVAGKNPLYFACKHDHVNMVRVLLTNTPKPNLNLGNGREQPLSIAIYYSYTEIVALLLEAGVDINSAVPMILEYQAKIDWKSSQGSGILRLINQRTEVATVKHLIRCSVDPEDANKKGEYTIWVTVRINNKPVAQYLASLNMMRIMAETGVDVNFAVPGDGETPLQAACNREVDSSKLNNTLEIIQYLIQKGARVNDSGGNLRSALYKIYLSSAPEVIKLFLDAGADTNYKNLVGRTPAHLVCYQGLEHYRALSPSKDILIARDLVHRTALPYTMISRDVDLVEKILESHKQHPNYQNTYMELVDKDG